MAGGWEHLGEGVAGCEVSVEGKGRDLAPQLRCHGTAGWDCDARGRNGEGCRRVAGREGVKAWIHPGRISPISAPSILPLDQSQRRS